MPRADEYAGAAAWCDAVVERTPHFKAMSTDDATKAHNDAVAENAALAARCVRAMAAWADGSVDLWRGKGTGAWVAVRLGADGEWMGTPCKAADPLDAITAALGGDDGK